MKKLYALVILALMLSLPQIAFSNDEATTEKAEEAIEQTAEQAADATDEDAKKKMKLKHGEMDSASDDSAAAETTSTSEESEEDEDEEDEEPDCE